MIRIRIYENLIFTKIERVTSCLKIYLIIKFCAYIKKNLYSKRIGLNSFDKLINIIGYELNCLDLSDFKTAIETKPTKIRKVNRERLLNNFIPQIFHFYCFLNKFIISIFFILDFKKFH